MESLSEALLPRLGQNVAQRPSPTDRRRSFLLCIGTLSFLVLTWVAAQPSFVPLGNDPRHDDPIDLFGFNISNPVSAILGAGWTAGAQAEAAAAAHPTAAAAVEDAAETAAAAAVVATHPVWGAIAAGVAAVDYVAPSWVPHPLSHLSTGTVFDGGNSKTFINLTLLRILCGVAAFAIVGHLVECAAPRFAPSEGRPRVWLIAFMIASYCLLIPGVNGILFSFAFAFKLDLGERREVNILITQDAEANQPGPVTESMMSVIDVLFKTSNITGALLVILYAFIMPAVKVLLIILGEVWRHADANRARKCIQCVQHLSKWACPDMFAYIMFLYLLRVMPAKTSAIEAPSHLDVGFTCFSVFCICSTFSSLWIRLPQPAPQFPSLEDDQWTAPSTTEGQACTQTTFRFMAPVLGIIFALLLWCGMTHPCMGLRLHPSWMVIPGGLPDVARPLIDKLDLQTKVSTDVTVCHCIAALTDWVSTGDWNCIVAFVMLAVFAIGLPVLDMLCLMVASWGLYAQKVEMISKRAMSAAHVFHHVSMLGPMVMGILVICLGCSSYKKQGVEFILEEGWIMLLFAEVVHYFTFYTIESAVDAAECKHTVEHVAEKYVLIV